MFVHLLHTDVSLGEQKGAPLKTWEIRIRSIFYGFFTFLIRLAL